MMTSVSAKLVDSCSSRLKGVQKYFQYVRNYTTFALKNIIFVDELDELNDNNNNNNDIEVYENEPNAHIVSAALIQRF